MKFLDDWVENAAGERIVNGRSRKLHYTGPGIPPLADLPK